MTVVVILLISILGAAWQLTWLPDLAILGVVPNLMLVGVLAWAVWPQAQKKDWFILMPVLVFDLLAGQPFGLMTLGLCLTFFFVDGLGGILFKQNGWLAVLSLIFLGSLFFELSQIVLVDILAVWHLAAPAKLAPFYFYAVLPASLLYNGFLAWLAVLFLNKIKINGEHGFFSKFKQSLI